VYATGGVLRFAFGCRRGDRQPLARRNRPPSGTCFRLPNRSSQRPWLRHCGDECGAGPPYGFPSVRGVAPNRWLAPLEPQVRSNRVGDESVRPPAEQADFYLCGCDSNGRVRAVEETWRFSDALAMLPSALGSRGCVQVRVISS
jgi:hypothetical protein